MCVSDYFPLRLKQIMAEKEIGVNELAKLSGVSGAHISRILNEKRSTPSPKTIMKLSKALNADYDSLMEAAGYIVLYDGMNKRAIEHFKENFIDFLVFLKKNNIDSLSRDNKMTKEEISILLNYLIDNYGSFPPDEQNEIFESFLGKGPIKFNIHLLKLASCLFSAPQNTSPINSFTKVPIIGRIPAGAPQIAEEFYDGYEDIPSSWLNGDPHSFFILKVEGDSMEGAKIFDGDLALIKKCPTCENGQICAVGITGETPDLYATLKRIYSLDRDYLELVPENSKYPRRKIKRSEVNIFGVLKKVIRNY
jgi:SOS-response transcriptional repressor LexA